MDDTDDVLDVRAEIDRTAHQMGAFAKSGQSRRIDLVPSPAQQPRHPLVAPAAMPGAVNQNEGGHGRPPAIGRVGATYDSVDVPLCAGRRFNSISFRSNTSAVVVGTCTVQADRSALPISASPSSAIRASRSRGSPATPIYRPCPGAG